MLKTLYSFDFKISEDLVSIRSDFWNHFFNIITWLGSWQGITVIFITTSIAFILYKNKILIWPLLISIAGSGITAVIIKYLVNRARPGAGISLYTEIGSSFPSAHAALIFASFGFLTYYISESKINFVLKIILVLLFILIITFVGFSRIYLGVHFTTDVLAGYLVGLLWVFIATHLR